MRALVWGAGAGAEALPLGPFQFDSDFGNRICQKIVGTLISFFWSLKQFNPDKLITRPHLVSFGPDCIIDYRKSGKLYAQIGKVHDKLS